MPGHLQTELIQATESGQVGANEAAPRRSVRHVEVFQIRRVGTLILGRPRPLPPQRRADQFYTLNCEEPRNLPCHSFDANAAWLEIVLAAADLVAWAQLIGFTGIPELARAEITAFRYRVLHVAARITRGARQVRLRIDTTWRWAAAIATAWQHLRSAFP